MWLKHRHRVMNFVTGLREQLAPHRHLQKVKRTTRWQTVVCLIYAGILGTAFGSIRSCITETETGRHELGPSAEIWNWNRNFAESGTWVLGLGFLGLVTAIALWVFAVRRWS